jgi:gliding motility-associated-like protein
MNFKKHLFSTLIGCCCFFSLFAQKGIHQGVIQVKLTQESDQQLKMAAKPLYSNSGPLKVGIKSLDDVNMRYNATEMRPMFTIGGPYEERQRRYELHLWYEIIIDETADMLQAANDFLHSGSVIIAEPEYAIRHISETFSAKSVTANENENSITTETTSNDPRFRDQWHYVNTGQVGMAGIDIRLTGAWDITKGNPNVIVSVVDGGIDYIHEDLAGNMWPGIGANFLYSGSGRVTAHSHGTHVAGTIAAVTNNGKGVAGIAGGWGADSPGVQLMSCQIFEDNVSGGARTADAYRYAADNGALISQNSWGYEEPGVSNSGIRTAIQYFIDNAGKDNNNNPLPGTLMAGGIVIFAAGNSNSDRSDWYPGMWPEVLCVAAVGPRGRRASYSNYSAAVDITAPGGDVNVDSRAILSTDRNNTYSYKQGTSMACPHVSGVAALVVSWFGNENYTPEMLRERLLLSVNPIPTEPMYEEGLMGTGLIDATKALADFVPVTGVSLPETIEAYVNRIEMLRAEVLPENATNKNVSWTSSNQSVATIDTKGNLKGISAGTTTITAVTNDGGFSATATAYLIPIDVKSIHLSPKNLKLTLGGDSRSLSFIINPDDAANKNVTWASLEPNIVSVDAQGRLSALELGNARIVVTTEDGGHTDTSFVEVVRPVSRVELAPKFIGLVVGDTSSINVIITPEDAQDRTVRWSMTNDIISISNDRTITANKAGNTTLTVTTNDGNFTANATVDVYEKAHAPEGFSPNNDGFNDYFEITMDSREIYALRVFDKSGQVYYTSDDYKNNWGGVANTGTHSGKKVPAGTYFYSISAKNTGKATTGYVVIKY